MKLGLLLAALILLVFHVEGQSTNAAPTKTEAPAQVHTPTKISPSLPFVLRQTAPNEIVSGEFSYTGVGVEIAKSHSVLELFNPITPPKGASPEQNLARDPVNGRVQGLKFFAFHF